MLKYIINFLQNRKFKTVTNGYISTERNQENGVPQGETLSVILI